MPGYAPMFRDRKEAGLRLAELLARWSADDPIVYALPRGGVPVAAEIAKALKAPLDLLLVRKIGAPGSPELALGAVVDGDPPQTVINESVRVLTGATDAFLDEARARELAEIARRRRDYLGDRTRPSPAGRTVIVVDDGLATGATARAALQALKRLGARKTILAAPVAPPETLAEMRGEADEVVCVHAARPFYGVGAFYDDFHQLDDEETLEALHAVWDAPDARAPAIEERAVRIPPLDLGGDLQVPAEARGIVVFAHGSGSSRLSPRNRFVADALARRGFATLLFDLLNEPESTDRRNVFDIGLLADRLAHAIAWVDLQPDLARLPMGLFGASTGAAAALTTAARLDRRIAAVVSRGGRPDLAGEQALAGVKARTLLIVGSRDHGVIELNEAALEVLACDKRMDLTPGAGHLFEEPGALEHVIQLAGDWFDRAFREPASRAPEPTPRTPAERLLAAAEPLPDLDDAGFAAAFDRFADARIVLLGEASHGTSEFYRARAAISRRLIERHGFDIVAVEADWPDAAAVDRYVRHKPHQAMSPAPFTRFPTWMWRNAEFEAFVDGLREINARRPPPAMAGFYGLDLYNMRAAMAAVLDYLDQADPEAAKAARENYACLNPWSAEPAAYGKASLMRGFGLCEAEVIDTLRALVLKGLQSGTEDRERLFDAAQNARLVANAERYYRVMYFGSDASWNLRDTHMFETLEQILKARGPKSKAIVWAHNSHIGDARFTAMGAERGELNLGQLCRERFGREAALIGFGTHAGTVLAADNWDEPGRAMAVRPSRSDSYEALFHGAGRRQFLLDLRQGKNEALRRDLLEPRLERYIGVIYRPDTELVSHYARSSLPEQFDAFVWFDETRAVRPLPSRVFGREEETYPFGL